MGNAKATKPPAPLAPTAATAPAATYHPPDKHGVDLGHGRRPASAVAWSSSREHSSLGGYRVALPRSGAG